MEEGLSGGELLGTPIPVKTVLLKFRDGHGKEQTKLAIVIPGGEIYFMGKEAVDLRPAQQWLKAAVLKSMGE